MGHNIQTYWQHSEEIMCRLQNIAMCDYQKSVTTRQTDGQMPDKAIPMCRYASQATQKVAYGLRSLSFQ